MTANKRRYQPSRALPPTRTDHVAPMMVAGWSSAKRARIRGILLALLLGYPQDADLCDTPEMRVVTMIDRAEMARCG